MAHVNGIAGAGVTEATRLAQTVVHRGAEAAALVVAGQREDRLRAERIPEAPDGDRIGEREGRDRGRPRGDGDAREGDRGPDDESPSGSLIDVQV